MRCPNCGQRLSDTVIKCPSCGLNFTEEDRLMMSEKEEQKDSFRDDTREDENPYRPAGQSQQTAAAAPVKRGFFDDGLPETEPYHGKMKWYWFVTRIQLLLSALVSFLNAYLYISGALYVNQAETLYGTYPALGILDKVYGAFLISMAILAFLTRSKLKNYMKGAPKQLIIFYILSLVGTVVYMGVEMIIVKQNLITNDLVMSILISVFMICVNIYYFRHRNHLFCN